MTNYGKKNRQHIWAYVGVSKTPMWEGELQQCQCKGCGKIRLANKSGYTIIGKKKFKEIHISGSENW